MLQCVAVCCSDLQCVAVCCSMLQCVAVCCHVLRVFPSSNDVKDPLQAFREIGILVYI